MDLGNDKIDFDGVKLQYNLEAEQSVLGSILIDSSCLNKVIQILNHADYFYSANHKAIYSVMLEMFTMGQPVDYVTVLDKLKGMENIDYNHFKSYLLQLAQIVPSVSNVSFYADIVKDKYNLRKLVGTAKEIISDASSGDVDSADLLNSAEQKIFDIRRGKETHGLQRINEIVIQTFDRLDELNSRTDQEYSGLPTGIRELDRVIMGLNKTDLILLASRPGMGKTSFSLNIAEHVGIVKNKKVAIFSLEMSKEQLVSRMLSTQAKISGQNLRLGKLSEKEWMSLIEAGDVLSKAPIYIDDTPGITIPEMKAKLRRLGDVDLVIIDYLQLMSSPKRIDNRVQEISEITRNLKIMAKELDVPVLTLSQLSRASEQRADHKPMLSDLRDSGSIEQDADIVMFLYREGYYGSNEVSEEGDKNHGECIVAKNRHGETRTVDLHWQGEYMRFTAQEAYRSDF
ncbi:MAG: replicative DNA helicase [Clostridia bacterium]|nr:replicative DNA helicase [Clostridia bacterium]MBQ6143413.1 replicative DNA helicase [Clostridia bacterium]